MRTALVLVDVQRGFDDPYWGRRNNPSAEANIAALRSAWEAARQPIVVVRHDSIERGSPLAADAPGNALKPELDGIQADLWVIKTVNSSFHGDVDLDRWLRGRGVGEVVLAGIQTNMCVETTARVGGNLGHRVTVALDATFTFDLAGPDGGVVTADELTRATAANLHGGGFARISSTGEQVAGVQRRTSSASPA